MPNRLSAVMNSCLMFLSLHSLPNYPSLNSPPSYDRTTTTSEGTPSNLRSERNLPNVSAASDLWEIKYIHAKREQSSLVIIGYFFPPADFTCFLPPRSTKTQTTSLLLTAQLDVFDRYDIRILLACEHPLHPCNYSTRVTPMGMSVGYMEVINVNMASFCSGCHTRRNCYI